MRSDETIDACAYHYYSGFYDGHKAVSCATSIVATTMRDTNRVAVPRVMDATNYSMFNRLYLKYAARSPATQLISVLELVMGYECLRSARRTESHLPHWVKARMSSGPTFPSKVQYMLTINMSAQILDSVITANSYNSFARAQFFCNG